MKALLSGGAHFLGGSERQVLYGLLLKYSIHLNFALPVFCQEGVQGKHLSGIWGVHSERQILYGFLFKFLNHLDFALFILLLRN
jgi:hypothetical protein